VISAALYLNQEGLLKTFHLQEIISKPQTLFLNPIHTLSPLALILAYTVLLELLIRQPKALLNDGYRLALASLVVFAPIALAFFAYHPARYYLPIVPAALLIVIERFTLNIPHNPGNRLAWFSLNTVLAAITFLALSMTLMASVNYYILSNLPINIGGDPGLSDPALLKLFPLFLILFTVFAVVIAKRYWSDISTGFYTSLTGFHVIIGLGILIAVLAYPSYQARQIRELLSHQVKQDESIGGDWAPLFVADTNLHALYMRPDFNSADIVRDIRPDYFLHSDTPYDQKTFAGLKLIQDIKLGKPLELGRYAGHNISLHSIDYLELDAPRENNLVKPPE
jgi:hypothetical protein